MLQHKFRKIYSIQLILLLLIVVFLGGCATSKKAKLRERRLDIIIQTARSYTGTPYKWGGVSRSGMDCSGLLYVSFKAGDVNIPRVSKNQAKVGTKVRFGKLQKGDVVFFAMGKRRREITHAGLVTEVRGKNDVRFIHASSSVGVVEANIYTDYYTKKFRKARRYF
ncbi:C40 family peptidase [Marivirga sp.]|uniref:C40 family peptidase n=1 Tax=Marivirga sp. TaxID=2018662 RepID=UPI002D7F3436|nr:C40 family peptidase [Marivirga sp.]HET8860225.1 C40 family peptidase [Marivirga sp.]